MISHLTRNLIAAATLISGLLAGENIQRGVVDASAWQHVGVLCWAEYSRHADLSRNAFILYPVEAFSGMILSVAAAISFWRCGQAPRLAIFPIYAAALCTVGGPLMTLKAAPVMLSVGHLGNDPVSLQHAFDAFGFWSSIRGVFQVLAYFANLWSLFALVKPVS
jgi:hypothetical protein